MLWINAISDAFRDAPDSGCPWSILAVIHCKLSAIFTLRAALGVESSLYGPLTHFLLDISSFFKALDGWEFENYDKRHGSEKECLKFQGT
jgi:hypothetical protein